MHQQSLHQFQDIFNAYELLIQTDWVGGAVGVVEIWIKFAEVQACLEWSSFGGAYICVKKFCGIADEIRETKQETAKMRRREKCEAMADEFWSGVW